MGQALYRKYRSRKLSEVVGQEHITQTLEQALKRGRISHAYLFTGPRGVGKTSVARILAHEINNLPYDDDSSHIDIIEIDAASNRRIDEIRELREKVHVAPVSAKYKVYIIDEVHMLTREAFNALLKTLEEPPAHVVFILATTDAHKLPETIISRTQRFSFKPSDHQKTIELLATIAKSEKVKVSPDALALIAQHSGGSFRDSVSLLDQASSHGQKVEATDVQQLLGIPPAEAVQQLIDMVAEGASAAEVMASLAKLYDQGYQAGSIAGQLGQTLRDQLVQNKSVLSSEATLVLLSRLIEVPASRDPERFLEIVLLEMLPARQAMDTAHASEPVPSPKPVETLTKSKQKKVAEPAEPEPEEPLDAPAVKKTAQKPKKAQAIDPAIWPKVLADLKQKHNTLYGVVRMAQPNFRSDGTVELAFAFAFHQKRLNEAGNRKKLADTVQELTGQEVVFECILDKNATPPAPKVPVKAAQQEPTEDVTAISNIFGGAELLES